MRAQNDGKPTTAFSPAITLPGKRFSLASSSQPKPVVGVVMGYICLLSALEYFEHPALELIRFDYRWYFGWLLWVTAGVTVWTGVDYVIKYFYMIRSVLK